MQQFDATSSHAAPTDRRLRRIRIRHFFGKGWLQLEFDCIVLPKQTCQFRAKIIAVAGIAWTEWENPRTRPREARPRLSGFFPPPLPWKVLTLPAEVPRPTLKASSDHVALMEDVPCLRRVGLRDVPAAHGRVFTIPMSTPGAHLDQICFSDTPVMQNAPARLLRPGLPPRRPRSADMEGCGPASSWHRLADRRRVKSGLDHRPAALTLIALEIETIYRRQ